METCVAQFHTISFTHDTSGTQVARPSGSLKFGSWGNGAAVGPWSFKGSCDRDALLMSVSALLSSSLWPSAEAKNLFHQLLLLHLLIAGLGFQLCKIIRKTWLAHPQQVDLPSSHKQICKPLQTWKHSFCTAPTCKICKGKNLPSQLHPIIILDLHQPAGIHLRTSISCSDHQVTSCDNHPHCQLPQDTHRSQASAAIEWYQRQHPCSPHVAMVRLGLLG